MASTEVLSLRLDASHIALIGKDPLAHLAKHRNRTSYIDLRTVRVVSSRRWAKG
jgi:hypothetical protein